MLFKNGVENIRVASYNGERMAYDFLSTTGLLKHQISQENKKQDFFFNVTKSAAQKFQLFQYYQ